MKVITIRIVRQSIVDIEVDDAIADALSTADTSQYALEEYIDEIIQNGYPLDDMLDAAYDDGFVLRDTYHFEGLQA